MGCDVGILNEISLQLITVNEDDFISSIYQALELLGNNIGAERISIWNNYRNEKKELIGKKFLGWSIGSKDEKENVFSIQYKYDIPTWYAKNQKHEDISMSTEDGKSLLLIPIDIKNEFLGFFSFLYKKEIKYSEIEQKILKSAGILITSVILRENMTTKLLVAKEEALKSIKAKNEFLSRMSHEIRTPMNAITGMTLLAKKSSSLDEKDYYIKKIEDSSKQLLDIVNDILDFSKIEANKMEIVSNEFDFGDLIEHVMNVMQIKVEEKKQKLYLDLEKNFERNMVSDELRITQVLLNLLSNAVKFTPENGRIVLKVREKSIDSKTSILYVEVIDNGIGILPAVLPKLFQNFEQGDGGITRQYGGSGLGLAICQKIIQLMDGKIYVESKPGKGSAFGFEIKVGWGKKCRNHLEKEDAQVKVDGYDWSGKNILLVDDNEINREIVMGILKDTNVNIDCAENGQICIYMYANNPRKYDLIFMDMQMPVLDGISATKKIREADIEGCKEIPIVAMTANAFKEDKEKCLEAGMNDYLYKPIEVKKLYGILTKIL